MKYIITESQYKILLEDNDRLNRMVEKYLNTVFDNLTQVDTKFGPAYKFNDDEGYAILVSKTSDGKQLSIASPLINKVTSILNTLLDLDRVGVVKTISKYCREVLGINYDYIRTWPIKIPGPDEDVISEVNRVEDFEDMDELEGFVDHLRNNRNQMNVVKSDMKDDRFFHVEGADRRTANQLLKNFLKVSRGKARFIAFIDCEEVDFSGVDLCQYPELVFVNLPGTPNNFEETQNDCYEKVGEGYAFNK